MIQLPLVIYLSNVLNAIVLRTLSKSYLFSYELLLEALFVYSYKKTYDTLINSIYWINNRLFR